MVVVYLKEKKGHYLAQVLRVWLPRDQEWEMEHWIRLHLWGKAGGDPESFVPWWIDGERQCYLGKKAKGKMTVLWEDVYAALIRYRLDEPIQDGRIHDKDRENMKEIWGHHLQILTMGIEGQ